MLPIAREEEFKEILRLRLSEPRYTHSLNVAKTARELALKYGADEEKAYTAGLLHDILKDDEKSAQREYLERSGVILTECERLAPKLWHAMGAAIYLRENLGITDGEILSAVRYHTTARAGMSTLERVLYIADFISEDRTYDGVERMRQKASESLEKAMLEGLQFTIIELADEERTIHPDTLAAYNETVYITAAMKRSEK
ncbi:MAG: HD domain-containing protein [Clostridiales bacterium]|nr:HD domain-containing protein [Clostridiales bacterium]